jgi:hypothetical protein
MLRRYGPVLLPYGLPFGLPDCPGLKRVAQNPCSGKQNSPFRITGKSLVTADKRLQFEVKLVLRCPDLLKFTVMLKEQILKIELIARTKIANTCSALPSCNIRQDAPGNLTVVLTFSAI